MSKRNPLPGIIKVGSPLLISQMSQFLMSLADTAMVGRLGEEALAAIALGGTVTWMLFVFCWPVSVGVQAVASRRFGANQALLEAEGAADTSSVTPKPLMPVLGAGLVSGTVAVCLALLVSLLTGPVFSLVLTNPGVGEDALDYVVFTRWATIFITINMAVQGFMSSMRRTREVMYLSLVTNLLNIFLNWILIFGKAGLPAMGLAGAALATLISQGVMSLLLLMLMLIHPALEPYRRESLKPESGMTGQVGRLCLPVMVQNGFALMVFLIFKMFVEGIGVVYLATAQVIFTLFRINKTIVGGFAKGAGILAGNALGAGDESEARRIMFMQQALGLVIGLLMMTLVLLVPGTLAKLFTTDPNVLGIAPQALRFFAVFYLVEISAYSLEVVFQSLGYSRYVLFSEVSTNILFTLLGSYLLVTFTNLGIWGAWLGFALYQVGHALILLGGWFSGRWLRTQVNH